MAKASKYSSILGLKPPDLVNSDNVIRRKIINCDLEKNEKNAVFFQKNYEKSIWPHEIPYHVEPRPDLTEDTKVWQVLLHNALQLDEPEREVYGLLHGIRCIGGHIEVEKKGRERKIKLTRGEIPENEWAEIKTNWLSKQVEGLRNILSVTEELGKVETTVSPNAPWWVKIEVVELDGQIRIVGPGTVDASQMPVVEPKAKQESLFGEVLTIERL